MNLNRARLVVLICFVLAALPVTAAPSDSERVRIHGTDYVALIPWARARKLDAHWLKRDETLQFTNRTTKFRLTVDSREAWINNFQVWLLYPLFAHGGEIFIAQTDLDNTLRPLLSPSRAAAGEKIKTIALDPGHGGKDPGNRVNGKEEKDYTLRLAFELRDQLKQAGFTVLLTRSTDKFIELPDRPAIANRQKADVFICLHFNSTANGRNEAHGAEVYALTPAGAPSTNAQGEGHASRATGNQLNEKNILLAHQIQKSLVQNLRAEDRGVRRARFAVLRDTTMPAAYIEAGFMSHPAEGRKIFDAAYRKEMARAITQGILAYKRAVERGG